MIIPPNWDNTTAAMGGERLPAGAYVCVIKSAPVEKARSGREQLVLYLDIAEGKNKGHFQRLVQQWANGGKWPYIYYQGITDEKGNANPWFKGMIETICASNPGYTWAFDELTLVGKYVGFLFREEEYQSLNGLVKSNVKPFRPCTLADARSGSLQPPEPKRLAEPQPTSVQGDYASYSPGDDGYIPWA
jgi:hypothetical protein